MRLAAGLRADPLGELQRSHRPPSRCKGGGGRATGSAAARRRCNNVVRANNIMRRSIEQRIVNTLSTLIWRPRPSYAAPRVNVVHHRATMSRERAPFHLLHPCIIQRLHLHPSASRARWAPIGARRPGGPAPAAASLDEYSAGHARGGSQPIGSGRGEATVSDA